MRKIMKIAGYEVIFPFEQPYSSQQSIIYKVLHCLDKEQNALLESPTGTGKSLALLCSCLAWLEKQKKEFKKSVLDLLKEKTEKTEQILNFFPINNSVFESELLTPSKITPSKTSLSLDNDEIEPFTPPDANNNVGNSFGFISARNLLNSSQSKEESQDPISPSSETSPTQSNSECISSTQMKISPNLSRHNSKSKKIPKIYFCTRTHGQIQQMIKELKSTTYKPKMSVLGSRKHFCINEAVAPHKNRNDECLKLVLQHLCKFNKNVSHLKNARQLKSGGELEIWDIEDLVQLGKEKEGCPYYASKTLASESEIIFSPYNYLLDPKIRQHMDLDLEGSIIIIDECHNIEDTCLNAASFDCEFSSILETSKELTNLSQILPLAPIYGSFSSIFKNMAKWIEIKSQSTSETFSYLDGKLMLEELKKWGISKDTLPNLINCYQKIFIEEPNGENSVSSSPLINLSSRSATLLEGFVTVWQFLFSSQSFSDDYKMFISKTSGQAIFNASQMVHSENEEVSLAQKMVSGDIKFGFWCMNPACAFSLLTQSASSIILSSGTMAPLDSFSSELNTKFQISFEAPHVIDNSQIWVGTMGKAPDGSPLTIIQKNCDERMLDSIGDAILQICRNIPKGVLCFFPSYRFLDQIKSRWKTSGFLKKLQSERKVIFEPRSDPDQFESSIQQYYKAIQQGKGAIFFAVCRGKVSEGLDFADDNARAVIIVGIPFPNTKDPQINLKKQYNSQNNVKRGLLDGNSWYSLQAFRAINQAVGRCIRHKQDYGAIILLDERFNDPANQQKLPKWIAPQIKKYEDFTTIDTSLQKFFLQNSENSNLKAKVSPVSKDSSQTSLSVPTSKSTQKFSGKKRARSSLTLHSFFKSKTDSTNSSQIDESQQNQSNPNETVEEDQEERPKKFPRSAPTSPSYPAPFDSPPQTPTQTTFNSPTQIPLLLPTPPNFSPPNSTNSNLQVSVNQKNISPSSPVVLSSPIPVRWEGPEGLRSTYFAFSNTNSPTSPIGSTPSSLSSPTLLSPTPPKFTKSPNSLSPSLSSSKPSNFPSSQPVSPKSSFPTSQPLSPKLSNPSSSQPVSPKFSSFSSSQALSPSSQLSPSIPLLLPKSIPTKEAKLENIQDSFSSSPSQKQNDVLSQENLSQDSFVNKTYSVHCKRCGTKIAQNLSNNNLKKIDKTFFHKIVSYVVQTSTPQIVTNSLPKAYAIQDQNQLAEHCNFSTEPLIKHITYTEVFQPYIPKINSSSSNSFSNSGFNSPNLSNNNQFGSSGGITTIWIPADGIAYAPLFCFGCASGNHQLPWCVGVKIVAVDATNISDINQIWLVESALNRRI